MRRNIYALLVGIILGIIGEKLYLSKVNILFAISLGEWVQIVASISAAMTAFFAWRAITKTEEMQLKPIIAMGFGKYSFGRLKVNMKNMSSKESDRFARNVYLKIIESEKSISRKGYFNPRSDKWLDFGEIPKSAWQNNTLEVGYETMYGKKYTQSYKFSGDTEYESKIHDTATVVRLERIH